MRIAPENVFEWIDITIDTSSLERLSLTYVAGLKMLHAVDSHGKIHVGIDAFILIWCQIPHWRFLAKMTRVSFIYPLAKIAYRFFAAWRFNRLAHCQIAINQNHGVQSTSK